MAVTIQASPDVVITGAEYILLAPGETGTFAKAPLSAVFAALGGGGAVSSVNGDTGAVTLNQDDIPDGTTAKQYTATEKTKLSGIATGATANDTDANLKNRANHTGTQAISTVTGLQAAIDGKQPTLVSGTNIKTVNGESILGSGDIVVEGGSGGIAFEAITTVWAWGTQDAAVPELTGNVAITVTGSPVAGKCIKFVQDGTGGHTVTINGQSVAVATGANTVTIFSLVEDENGDFGLIKDTSYVPISLTPPADLNDTFEAYRDAIIAEGGTLSEGHETAYNTYLEALDTAGVLADLDFKHFLCGGSEAATKLNVVNPLDTDGAYRLTFNNGATFNATGVLGNGTNQTISSHCVPGLAAQMAVGDVCIGVYHRTSAGVNNPAWGISESGAQMYLFPKEASGNGAARFPNCPNTNIPSPSTAKGLWIIQSDGTNTYIYRDGTLINTIPDSAAGDTLSVLYDIVFNGWNAAGTPGLPHAGELSVIFGGKFLNNTKRQAVEAAMAQLVTDLSL